MKTKTYDLNLYIIDGHLKVLAHELEVASDGHIQTGCNFVEALNIELFRANRSRWQPILDLFEETEVYDELDSWWRVPLADEDTPMWSYNSEICAEMKSPELVSALKELPAYEMVSYA